MKKLLDKIKKAIALPIQLKILVVEGLIYSLVFEVIMALGWFKRLLPLHQNQLNNGELSIEQKKKLRLICRSVQLIKKYAPWQPKCYNQSLTAKQMLKKRKIDVSMHIGFKRDKGELKGHSWITHQGRIITGFVEGINEFHTIEGAHILQKYY